MIDHVFIFVEKNGPEISHMASLDLVETYRRNHAGQGTQNVCYCFDNLFLELLWVNDCDSVRSEGMRRSGLYERSLWRKNGACPFGIAWRKSQGGLGSLIPTWEFAPPYLSKGMSIPVAIDSDDPRQPMMFESPGSIPPIDWPVEKRGSLQHGAGLGAVAEIRLRMPVDVAPSYALRAIAQSSSRLVGFDEAGDYGLQLRIGSLIGEPDLEITLPML